MSDPTILLVDDDPLLLQLVEAKLKAEGFAVLLARDGETALDLLTWVRPAAIILDAMMPGIGGFEVLRRLKAKFVWRSCPVIMLTAVRRQEDVIAALKTGAADYLAKPFTPDELIERVKRVIANSPAA